MKRRNPHATRGALRKPLPIPGDPRTPGRMLFDMVMNSSATGAAKIKMIEAAARTLAAEARAGLWSRG